MPDDVAAGQPTRAVAAWIWLFRVVLAATALLLFDQAIFAGQILVLLRARGH